MRTRFLILLAVSLLMSFSKVELTKPTQHEVGAAYSEFYSSVASDGALTQEEMDELLIQWEKYREDFMSSKNVDQHIKKQILLDFLIFVSVSTVFFLYGFYFGVSSLLEAAVSFLIISISFSINGLGFVIHSLLFLMGSYLFSRKSSAENMSA